MKSRWQRIFRGLGRVSEACTYWSGQLEGRLLKFIIIRCWNGIRVIYVLLRNRKIEKKCCNWNYIWLWKVTLLGQVKVAFGIINCSSPRKRPSFIAWGQEKGGIIRVFKLTEGHWICGWGHWQSMPCGFFSSGFTITLYLSFISLSPKYFPFSPIIPLLYLSNIFPSALDFRLFLEPNCDKLQLLVREFSRTWSDW